MKIVLATRTLNKGYILYVNELKNDEDFVPHRQCYFECEHSERWEVDEIINEQWKKSKGKGSIFNQCRWQGTTGWEFWSDDQDAILQTAMNVATLLSLDLTLT